MTELLVGSKKGLFVLRGEPGDAFEVAHRAFAGDVVEYALRDPRSGRYFASVTSGFYGPRLYFADDPAGEWRQATGPALPEDIPDSAVTRIWVVQPAEEPGVLWAGAAPASLWRSEDDGESWTLNRPLWNVPDPARSGSRAPAASALHSICPWPGDPDRLAVGISAAGVWLSDDRGETLAHRLHGARAAVPPGGRARGLACALRPRHAPRSARSRASLHAVPRERVPQRRRRLDVDGHRLRAALRLRLPARRRSGRPGQRLRHPAHRGRRPGHAGRARARLRDARRRGELDGRGRTGCRPRDAYLTVLRQAFDADAGSPPSLYFGATSGDVFGSADGGASWFAAATRIAPVNSVRISG